MDIEKNDIRQKALASLHAVPKAKRLANSAKTRQHLKKLLDRIKPKSALIYQPIPFEADLRALFRPLRARGKLYSPLVQTISFKMVKFRLPLERHSLGFFSPRMSGVMIKKVDTMIVPCLAVDRAFRRIGFGKGMYDRFYASLRHKPIVIFIQPFLLQTKSIVTNDWDIRGDYLVSANGVKAYKGNPSDRDRNRHFCRSSRSAFSVADHQQD